MIGINFKLDSLHKKVFYLRVSVNFTQKNIYSLQLIRFNKLHSFKKSIYHLNDPIEKVVSNKNIYKTLCKIRLWFGSVTFNYVTVTKLPQYTPFRLNYNFYLSPFYHRIKKLKTLSLIYFYITLFGKTTF